MLQAELHAPLEEQRHPGAGRLGVLSAARGAWSEQVGGLPQVCCAGGRVATGMLRRLYTC